MAQLAADKQADFIDAPVSGGQAGAENGVLSIMCGGSQAAYDRAQPLLTAYGKTIERMGETGAGQLRSEEHTSELQSRGHLVCRLLLEKKKNKRPLSDEQHH